MIDIINTVFDKTLQFVYQMKPGAIVTDNYLPGFNSFLRLTFTLNESEHKSENFLSSLLIF